MKKKKKLVLGIVGVVSACTLILTFIVTQNGESLKNKFQAKEHEIEVTVFDETSTVTFKHNVELVKFIETKKFAYSSELSDVTSTTYETIINGEVIEDCRDINFREVDTLVINVFETTVTNQTEEKAETGETVTSKVTTNYKNGTMLDISSEVISTTKPVPENLSHGTAQTSIYIDNPSSITAVVNKNRMLESTYVPSDLVSITVTSTKSGNDNLIRSEALPHVEAMFADAKADGVNLTVTSAYRSYDTQNSLFNSYVNSYGLESALTFSAPPGASEHQTGLVLDIGEVNGPYDNFEIEFALSDSGKWLAANSYKYGFILRYPEGKEAITTYQYEPWHFRYVGVETATKIHESGLTLEEYYDLY